MNERELEAVKYLKQHIFDWQEFDIEERVDIILNLAEKQERIIDNMSKYLTTDIHSDKWVKEYFERKVEEQMKNEKTEEEISK